jgi:hypothetical protein
MAFDRILADRKMLSPDGRRLAYGAKSGRDWWVIVDGRREGPYREIRDEGAFQSSSRPALAARPVDTTFDSALQFSPDGEHFAYVARSEREWFVVRDGAPGKTYRHIDSLAFSPDSQHLLYRGVTGDTYVKTLSSSGSLCPAFVVYGGWTLMVDEKPSPASHGGGWLVHAGFKFDSAKRFRFLSIDKDIILLTRSVQ